MSDRPHLHAAFEPVPDGWYEQRAAEVVAAGGRLGHNEYGTWVSIHECATCGREFTLCPPTTEATFGSNCLDPDCPSYDPARDAEVFFAPDDPTLIEQNRGSHE